MNKLICRKNTWLWIVITMLASCQSNNDNDLKILKEQYTYTLVNSKYFMMEKSRGNEKVKEILPLLDTLIHYVEIDKKLPQEVKQQMLKHLKENKPEGLSNNIEIYDYLLATEAAFETDQLSKIETYNYIAKFFIFEYWLHWRCNESFYELNTFFKMDTLYLKANKTQELQLQIVYNDAPSIRILSNSIQGKRANRIKFNTGPHTNQLKKIPFDCRAINDFVNKPYIYKDTLKFYTIQ